MPRAKASLARKGTLGAQLRAVRLSHQPKIPQETLRNIITALSGRLVPEAYISRWETGRRPVEEPWLLGVKEFLSDPLRYMEGGEPTVAASKPPTAEVLPVPPPSFPPVALLTHLEQQLAELASTHVKRRGLERVLALMVEMGSESIPLHRIPTLAEALEKESSDEE